MNFNRPTYCPLHNKQRRDFIKWYYENIKNEPIPESLKFTTSGIGYKKKMSIVSLVRTILKKKSNGINEDLMKT